MKPTDNFQDRKKLSFEQAEGAAPLPSQLQLREVSQELRAVLWKIVHDELHNHQCRIEYGPTSLNKPWSWILNEEFILRRHGMTDDFVNNAKELIKEVRKVFEHGDYLAIFGWLEFVLKHRVCPIDFHERIESSLQYCRAAYRVVDKTVICPIASDAEHQGIAKAFGNLDASQFHGARAHLRNAASQLTTGKFADSVRESIHAVEAVSRTLDSSADLSKALARLEEKISIHGAMRRGFTSLYGYTSDEGGIRHALLEGGEASERRPSRVVWLP